MNKTRRLPWMCLALGGAAHLLLMGVRGLRPQQKASKPLTTQFVKRQPRLTKPLELKKRPQPRQRQMRRTMLVSRVRTDREQIAARTARVQIIRGLTKPKARIARGALFEHGAAEPSALAQAIQSGREVKQMVDASLEMMDIEALDTGKYHAMIVQDPADKKSVRGFFHLAVVYCRSYLGVYVYDRQRYLTNLGISMNRLTEYMNRYTLIQTDLAERIYLETSDMYKVPWAFLSTYNSFQASEPEVINLGKYLAIGGFLFTDFVDHAHAPGDVCLRDLFKRALASQSYEYERSWVFETLPNTHHIYHCFFDFDGPPEGRGIYLNVNLGAAYRRDERRVDGITIGTRLLGLVSTKSYANAWGDWGPGGAKAGYQQLDPTRCLQFGVNSIVFALTQEGSITSQVMDIANY